jgi:outer membrane protein assembly factor BamB
VQELPLWALEPIKRHLRPRNLSVRVAILSSCIALLGALAVAATWGAPRAAAGIADWATYGATNGRSGFNGAETTITPSTAPQLHLAWTAAAENISPNLVFSQPVVANGLIYWASFDGYERATNTSGALVWQTYIGRTTSCVGAAASSPIAAGPQAGTATNGPASTATVVNGVVYVGGGDAQLYALDAATGAVRWQTRLGPSPSTFLWASPAVFNGSVYMGVASFANCPSVQGQLVRLDGTTGAVQNTMNTVPDGCTGASLWGSPTVDEASGTVYFATGDPGSCGTTEAYAETVIEVRASDLGLLGSWQVPPSQQVPDGDFGSTPILFTSIQQGVTQAMVGVANKNGAYYAFQRDNLAAGPVWQYQIAVGGNCAECGQGSISPGAWDGQTIYVAGGNTTINGVSCAGSVDALNPADGSILWQDCLPDGTVLGALAAAPGIVALGEGNHLLVVSATSGQTLFDYPTNSGLPIWGAPSIADGVLYSGENGGRLLAFAIDPSTNVLLPSNGATLTGTQYLDASTSDTGGVAKVEFDLTGSTLNNALIATATLTYYGWLAGWDTTTVANGTYTLQSVAYDASGASSTSTGVTITVNNPPTTTVIIPSNGATLSGTAATLDATASNATSVEFWLFGGSYGYTGHLIGTATLTNYGWLYSWDTTTVPNGSYALLSEAFGSGGSAFSSHLSITVNNAPPPTTSVIIPSNGATLSGTAATLDATASNATSVEFWLFGGSYGYAGHLIGTATPTYYGWLYSWDTTTVPNGSYALLSEAFGSGGSAFSSHLSMTVTN